jgi:hypothetical protein
MGGRSFRDDFAAFGAQAGRPCGGWRAPCRRAALAGLGGQKEAARASEKCARRPSSITGRKAGRFAARMISWCSAGSAGKWWTACVPTLSCGPWHRQREVLRLPHTPPRSVRRPGAQAILAASPQIPNEVVGGIVFRIPRHFGQATSFFRALPTESGAYAAADQSRAPLVPRARGHSLRAPLLFSGGSSERECAGGPGRSGFAPPRRSPAE